MGQQRAPAAVADRAALDEFGEEDRQAADDWAVIDRLRARNGDKDPDEVLADATAAVAEVRREMHGEAQRAASRGG